MKPEQPEDEFVSDVRKQAERSDRRKGPNLWLSFSLVGWVGWMVVLPALLGIVLGRLLDVHFHSGIFWTLSLLMLGLVLGCTAAWRHLQEVMKE